MSLVTVV